MYLMWSQMEEAWRDTLVHKAEGTAFQLISRFYGFPWPEDEVSERAWRGALHVEALGRRGTFRATFQALESAFSDFNEKATVEISDSLPYVLTRTDGGTWDTKHVNRYVRTPFGLLFTVGQPGGTQLTVCPQGTRYWDAPSYDVDTYNVTDVPIEILPFVVFERGPGPISESSDALYEGAPCLLEVELRAGALLTAIPPTYLQTEVDLAGTVVYNVTEGLSGGSVFALDDTAPAVGATVYFYRQSGGSPPTPFSSNTLYYVVVSLGSYLQLSDTDGGMPITLTSEATSDLQLVVNPDPDAVVPPDPAMPLGGHLLQDENYSGNSDGGGPYPVYLYDGDMFPSVQAAIQATLPSGVHVRVGVHPLI